MNLTNPKALADPNVQKAIADLTEDMRPIVDKIEHGMMSGTTQYNYGGYMSALSSFKTTESVMMFIIGNAMLAAGGNQAGIEWGIHLVANA